MATFNEKGVHFANGTRLIHAPSVTVFGHWGGLPCLRMRRSTCFAGEHGERGDEPAGCRRGRMRSSTRPARRRSKGGRSRCGTNADGDTFTLPNGQTVSKGSFWSTLDRARGKILWETADLTVDEEMGAITTVGGSCSSAR